MAGPAGVPMLSCDHVAPLFVRHEGTATLQRGTGEGRGADRGGFDVSTDDLQRGWGVNPVDHSSALWRVRPSFLKGSLKLNPEKSVGTRSLLHPEHQRPVYV